MSPHIPLSRRVGNGQFPARPYKLSLADNIRPGNPMEPELLAVLLSVFREAEAALPAGRHPNDKTLLAASILQMAEAGERERNRLLDRAVSCARTIGSLRPCPADPPHRAPILRLAPSHHGHAAPAHPQQSRRLRHFVSSVIAGNLWA